jgi:K+-sensing histidine kinase KdpD
MPSPASAPWSAASALPAAPAVLAIAVCSIEARGGRLWTAPNRPHGARVRLALPVEDDRAL